MSARIALDLETAAARREAGRKGAARRLGYRACDSLYVRVIPAPWAATVKAHGPLVANPRKAA